MLLHIRPLALAAVLALAALPASATNTLVDAHAPYSSGVVPLAVNDTASFTSGIALLGALFCGYRCDEDRFSYAVGYKGVPYGSIGFGWAPGVTRPRYCVGMPGIAGSPDSVWGAAGAAPDSILPIDTLYRSCVCIAIIGDTSYRSGLILREWVCTDIMLPPPNLSYWLPDWNIITYAHCPDSSHMAFQFAYDTVLGGPTGQVVRWAVDSAGNGLFKTGATPTAAPRAQRASSAAPARTPSAPALFDLRGRRVRGALPPGIYAQTSAAGAVRLLR
jgi:hypothetical protein